MQSADPGTTGDEMVRWFKDLRSDDIASVGGKNAALDRKSVV